MTTPDGKKGRVVLVSGGGTVGEYSGRFTKKEARSVIASHLNAFHRDFFAAADIHIVPNGEVQRLVKRGDEVASTSLSTRKTSQMKSHCT